MNISKIPSDLAELLEQMPGRPVITVDRATENITDYNEEAVAFVPGIAEGESFLSRVCGLLRKCEDCPVYAKASAGAPFKTASVGRLCSFAHVIFKDAQIDRKDCTITVWDTKDAPPSLCFVDGIDLAEGLKNCSGMYSAYYEIVKVFYGVGSEKMALIRELYEKKSIYDLRVEVHGLKGTLYVIGATELGDLAKACEFACRDIEADPEGAEASYAFIDANIGPLLESYGALLSALSPFVSEDSSRSGTVRTIEEIRALVKRAFTSLEEYELEDLAACMDELSDTQLEDNARLILGKAMHELSNYDYEKTGYYLKQINDLLTSAQN